MAHSLHLAEEFPQFGRRNSAVYFSIRQACELGQRKRPKRLDWETVAGITGAICLSATAWTAVGLAVFKWLK
jgi:hypothetical protein